MVHSSVFISFFGFVIQQCGAAEHPNITMQQFSEDLHGEYVYVDIMKLLRISTVNSFVLDMVCPKSISYSSKMPGDVVVRICSNHTNSNECHTEGNETYFDSNFKRITLINSAVPTDSADNPGLEISIQEIYNFYPLFQGNLNATLMKCPFLQLVTNETVVIAHDTGYLYTAINHYKNTVQKLGEPFNMTSKQNLATRTSSYYISIAMGSSEFVCTYLSVREKERFRLALWSVEEGNNNISQEHNSEGFRKSQCPTQMMNPTTSPTSSQTPEITPDSTTAPSAACFPQSSKVILGNGSEVEIQYLRIGDRVYDSTGTISPIVLFTHSHRGNLFEFISITLGDRNETSILLSPSHLIYANGAKFPTAANEINVGDHLTVVENHGSVLHPVVGVEKKYEYGLFNPHTASGKILVSSNGSFVLCSTYTTAVSPPIAHALLEICRCMSSFTTFGNLVSSWFLQGNRFLLHAFRKYATFIQPSAMEMR